MTARHRLRLIVSLTGNMAAYFWGKAGTVRGARSPKTLDADAVAAKMMSELGSSKTPRFVISSITDTKKKIKTADVNIAVIGIGALGGGHRLKRFKAIENDEHLSEIEKPLNNLTRSVNAHESKPKGVPPFRHLVGDVCNHLFVVDNVAIEQLNKNQTNELRTCVSKVNERFVCPSTEDLSGICDRGAVIAVAGGPHKVDAIWHVIRIPRRPWISHLVTDHFTAEILLQRYQAAHSEHGVQT